MAYPEDTLARLRRIKARVDPDNVFRHNDNIAPATGRGRCCTARRREDAAVPIDRFPPPRSDARGDETPPPGGDASPPVVRPLAEYVRAKF